MTLSELNTLIAHPDQLNASTLPPLQQLVEAYPYAHSIVMLYLLNLAALGDLRYEAELQRWAPHLPSREKLYLLSQMHLSLDELSPIVTDAESDPFALIDQYLREMSASEGTFGDELPYEGSAATPSSETATPPAGDYFSAQEYMSVEALPSFSPPAPPTETPAAKSEDPSDTLFTETLASIYTRQGHFAQAKEIIERLSLKYPEKNGYFAVQLDFLQKLIDNAAAE